MTNRATRSVSVVVPTYGNAQGLEPLVKDISRTLQRENRAFEILFVNDGSPDATWDAIQRLNGLHPEVRGINLMRNYGQHNALLAGILNARQEVIVTLDDDFQTPPTEIPKLLNKLDEGYDLVYGARDKEQHGLVRNLASRLTKWARSAYHESPARTFHNFVPSFSNGFDARLPAQRTTRCPHRRFAGLDRAESHFGAGRTSPA